MVGLKTFWIILSALFLGACVPQTKQTECGSNEAFNASLRTCVPVVGGPSSFINIASYTPSFVSARQKNDTTPISFTITVSNPYNQSYSVEWERVFNGAPTSICSTALTCSFPPSLLGTTYGEVGTHIITAKVKDGNGSVTDTHSFELKISEFPKPFILTTSISPNNAPLEVLPTDGRVEFKFSINNNGATIAGNNYRTVWTVLKNGTALYTESDSFGSNTSPTATHNTAYLGTAPTPWFNPATFGVGSYIVRATVQNDIPGEIVGEYQWNVLIRQPDLANITNISLPAPGITITAHHNVDYNDYATPAPALSWIYGSSATQPNFCVTVDDRNGTYEGDNKSILVKWYLNSTGGEICTKKTLDLAGLGSQTICLIDANNCEGSGAPFDTDILKFSNTSSMVLQNHKVTARLFDEATTQEFERADVVPSNGSYPIEWLVLVRPTNTAPVVGFGATATNLSSCLSAGAFSRNCTVTQGQAFDVSFTVTDDFYSAASAPEQFRWDVKLKRDGSDITTPDLTMNTSCSKALASATTAPASRTSGYSTEWRCNLNVPHYTAAGPLDPSSGSYQVVVTVEDNGSPVGGTALPAQSLTWNLFVQESNPASPGTILNPQTALAADSNISRTGAVRDPANTASFATELETIQFNLNVRDDELDDLKYRISLCTDNTATCSSSLVLTSPAYQTFSRVAQTVPTTNPALIPGLLYTLPEDLLIGKHNSIIDVDTATSRLVYFKVDVVDAPSIQTSSATRTITQTRSDSEIFQVYVRNFNPAPVINTATASPAVNSTTVVQAGFPFTIDPGSVTDASVPAAEKTIKYQWYSKIGAGAWTAITGATNRILRYTPGNASSTIDLKLCVGDDTLANTISASGNCSGSWFITPKKYLHDLTATGSGGLQNEMAVWYDNTNTVPNTEVIYSAYMDENKDIFVEKTVKNASNDIILTVNTIQMDALPGAAVAGTVSNISITGSDDSVYVAYLASDSSTPGNMVARVRRIAKDYDIVSTPSYSKSGLDHPAPFGFNYAHYTLTTTTSVAGIATATNGDGAGGFARITFTGRLNATTPDKISINGVEFSADSTPTAANEICDSNACPDIASTAASLAAKINTSTDSRLHGIVARASAGVVELIGQYNDDFLDFDGSISNVSGLIAGSNGLGKIFVAGGRWHLPMINASLAGSEQNNITILSAPVDVHMRSAGSAPSTNDNLTEMGKTALFDSRLNVNGELVFARISADLTDAGAIKLFRYTLTGSDWDLFDTTGGATTDRNSQDIFGSYSYEYVRLAADNDSNPYYYVIAREKTVNGGEYHIGRYNNELDASASVSENFLSSKVVTSDSTDDVVTDSRLKHPDIISVPGFSEARIFFHSVGTGTVPYPRLARWKSDDSVTCGTCFSLTGSLEHQSTARIGLSEVAKNITIGAAGSVVSENINDVVFALFSSDTTATDIFKPQLGIINIEAKAIQSTAIDSTGMFQPPFVLDQ